MVNVPFGRTTRDYHLSCACHKRRKHRWKARTYITQACRRVPLCKTVYDNGQHVCSWAPKTFLRQYLSEYVSHISCSYLVDKHWKTSTLSCLSMVLLRVGCWWSERRNRNCSWMPKRLWDINLVKGSTIIFHSKCHMCNSQGPELMILGYNMLLYTCQSTKEIYLSKLVHSWLSNVLLSSWEKPLVSWGNSARGTQGDKRCFPL